MKTKILTVLFALGLWHRVSANDTFVTFGVENFQPWSMTASFEWTVKKNGSTVASVTSWQNYTVYPGSQLTFYANLELTTNETATCTYTYGVYLTNAISVTPAAPAVNGTLTASWQSGVSSVNVVDPMQPPGGAPCYSNITVNIRNNDTSEHTYMLASYYGLAGAGASAPVPGAQLSPGQYGILSETVPCNMAYTYQVYQLPDNEVYDTVSGSARQNSSGGATALIYDPNGNGLTGTPLPQIPVVPSSALGDDGSGNLGGVPPAATGASPTSTLAGSSGSVVGLGQALSNIVWSATSGTTATADGAATVATLKDASSSMYALESKMAVNQALAAQQAHADAQTLANELTNGTGGNVSLNTTNLATDSTLKGLTNEMGPLSGSISNLAGDINNLANALTNGLADATNLDFASEKTLEGLTNAIGGMGTNIAGLSTNISLHLTNYAEETTLDVATNLLGLINSNLLSGLGGSNLTLAQLTNQVAAYGVAQSNDLPGALAQMSALTNGVAAAVGMQSIQSGVASWPSTPDTSQSGAPSVQNVTIGPGVVIPLGHMDVSYGGLRTVLAWSAIVGLFVWNWRTTYLRIRDAFTAQQTTTAGTEVLGTNVNLSSAMLMAVVIFAAITAIPTLAVALLAGEVTLMNSVSPLPVLRAFGFGYTFLDQYIPLATVVTAVMSRVVFMVAIDSLASVVMGIKLFLVGL